MKHFEDLMNRNYRIVLQYDPDGYWIAEHPELPGCKADGETAQKALTSLDASRKLWIESSLANDLEVPQPQEVPQYSGRFVLRIPKSLHRDLANEAEAEGVSLNTFVSNVLASRHTWKERPVSLAPQYGYLQTTPERVGAPSSNLRSISDRSRQVFPYLQSENKQIPEKELQYA